MGAAAVLGVVFVFLVVILAGLLRGIDREELRRAPSGPASLSGLRAIVGGGFLVGLGYGLLVGGQSGVETWRWLSRGVVDGLVVACAGAFYVGYQQRRRLRGGRVAGHDEGTRSSATSRTAPPEESADHTADPAERTASADDPGAGNRPTPVRDSAAGTEPSAGGDAGGGDGTA